MKSAGLLAAAGLLLVACAAIAPHVGIPDDLAARADAVLGRRGLGADTLSVIDNILRHDGVTQPSFSPLVVRELLARPLAAANAAALFDDAVPGTLRLLADDAAELPAASGAPARIEDLLDAYLAELAEAQRLLKGASKAPIDAPAILAQLGRELPSREALQAEGVALDPAAVDRANEFFLAATARFIRAVRAAGTGLRFPDRAIRFDSAIGAVVIGTTGDDVHRPGVALIVDPGGNDVYERAPVTGGAISVVIDLSGNDRYEGSDVVVHGLSAIVDIAGNDRYTTAGPGEGAAIAGAALIVDFAGDDYYEAGLFGQGAAAFGVGAILDLRGNDTYRVHAGGQGFAMTGGVGLLWDRDGNDAYAASGLADAFDRGGGISMAQGVATGFRTALGGGIGILRDDAGNDIYEAQMYAQGAGYYYGLGVLWDRGGDDHYRAVRYAQGAGVHQAVGVLRDENGSDRYELAVGVGQGMGLDLAVGMLIDSAGDDRYRSEVVAQGSATANGIGVLADSGGADEWRMGFDLRSWGRAEWTGRLPTTGLMLYEPSRAKFFREGRTFLSGPRAAEFGGPLGGEPVVQEAQDAARCPQAGSAAQPALPFAEALRRSEAGFAGGVADTAAYASAQLVLTHRLAAGVAELPHDDFDITWALGEALRCALIAASPDEASAIGRDMQHILESDPATPFAGALAFALRDRRPPVPQLEAILGALGVHPACSARAAALTLRGATAASDAARKKAGAVAQAELASSCWRMQAAALNVLRQFDIAPAGAPLPSFLRGGAIH